jgi:hypothetical protein
MPSRGKRPLTANVPGSISRNSTEPFSSSILDRASNVSDSVVPSMGAASLHAALPMARVANAKRCVDLIFDSSAIPPRCLNLPLARLAHRAASRPLRKKWRRRAPRSEMVEHSPYCLYWLGARPGRFLFVRRFSLAHLAAGSSRAESSRDRLVRVSHVCRHTAAPFRPAARASLPASAHFGALSKMPNTKRALLLSPDSSYVSRSRDAATPAICGSRGRPHLDRHPTEWVLSRPSLPRTIPHAQRSRTRIH